MADWNKVEKDIERGPFGLYKWVVIGVVGLALLAGAISLVSRPAEVIVDRVVFENSFQYKKGMEQRGAILEANLIEVEEQIRNASSVEEREGLLSQKRVFEAQLRAITINE